MFVLKHISGQANKVADALNIRVLLLQESTIRVLGFEHLKELYQTDADFKEAYEACQNPLLRNNSLWLGYNLQELLFKGGQLCVPECSMRENIIWEKHSGGLADILELIRPWISSVISITGQKCEETYNGM